MEGRLYEDDQSRGPETATWPSILTNGPKVVMSLAPEIILPGCFQQAQQALHHGNTLKGKRLFGL